MMRMWAFLASTVCIIHVAARWMQVECDYSEVDKTHLVTLLVLHEVQFRRIASHFLKKLIPRFMEGVVLFISLGWV